MIASKRKISKSLLLTVPIGTEIRNAKANATGSKRGSKPTINNKYNWSMRDTFDSTPANTAAVAARAADKVFNSRGNRFQESDGHAQQSQTSNWDWQSGSNSTNTNTTD